MKGERDQSLDAVRGIAVCLMQAANLWPYLHQSPPFWWRIPLSMAAPIFFFLAGYFAVQQPKFPAKNLLLALSVGILTDLLVWQTLPGFSVDVLYVLSAGILLVYSLKSVSTFALGGLAVGFLLLYLLLTKNFPYQTAVFSTTGLVHLPTDFSIQNWLNQLLVSGWFPILPWISIALVGAFAQKQVEHRRWIGLGLICLGIILQKTHPHHFGFRRGYPELFYPVSVQFVSIAAGVLLLLVEWTKRFPINSSLLSLLGRHSLSIYLLHELMIVRIIEPMNILTSSGMYALVLAGLVGMSVLLAKGMDRFTSSQQRA